MKKLSRVRLRPSLNFSGVFYEVINPFDYENILMGPYLYFPDMFSCDIQYSNDLVIMDRTNTKLKYRKWKV